MAADGSATERRKFRWWRRFCYNNSGRIIWQLNRHRYNVFCPLKLRQRWQKPADLSVFLWTRPA
jgi:hypothetical protein